MFAAEERLALLRHLLSRLDPARRAIVVAYELDGARMVDVAAALDIPVNTAWNRLRLGGTAPEASGATITTGSPGAGGTGDGDTGSGATGVAKEVRAF